MSIPNTKPMQNGAEYSNTRAVVERDLLGDGDGDGLPLALVPPSPDFDEGGCVAADGDGDGFVLTDIRIL